MQDAYRVLVGRPERKKLLERPRRKWEDNFKMDLREVGCDTGEWIDLAEDRDQWCVCTYRIHRRGVIGRVPAFQSDCRVRSQAGSEILISILGLVVFVLCFLSCVVPGCDSDIMLITHSGKPALVCLSSVLIHSLLLPYGHLTYGH